MPMFSTVFEAELCAGHEQTLADSGTSSLPCPGGAGYWPKIPGNAHASGQHALDGTPPEGVVVFALAHAARGR